MLWLLKPHNGLDTNLYKYPMAAKFALSKWELISMMKRVETLNAAVKYLYENYYKLTRCAV
jgi:hypothetical protein